MLQEGFSAPLGSSKISGLRGKGWELCDLARWNYVIVSLKFVATAPVWGQLDLISNLLCCIYWNCYVMPAVFMTAPIKFVTFKLHLQLRENTGVFFFLFFWLRCLWHSTVTLLLCLDLILLITVCSSCTFWTFPAETGYLTPRLRRLTSKPKVKQRRLAGGTCICVKCSKNLHLCWPHLPGTRNKKLVANLKKWIWQYPMVTVQLGSSAQ